MATLLNKQTITKAYQDKYNKDNTIYDSTNLQIFSLLSFMEAKGFQPVVRTFYSIDFYDSYGEEVYIPSYLELEGASGALGFHNPNDKEFKSFLDAMYEHNNTNHSGKIVKRIYLQLNKKTKTLKANKNLIQFGQDIQAKSNFNK